MAQVKFKCNASISWGEWVQEVKQIYHPNFNVRWPYSKAGSERVPAICQTYRHDNETSGWVTQEKVWQSKGNLVRRQRDKPKGKQNTVLKYGGNRRDSKVRGEGTGKCIMRSQMTWKTGGREAGYIIEDTRTKRKTAEVQRKIRQVKTDVWSNGWEKSFSHMQVQVRTGEHENSNGWSSEIWY